MLEVRRVDHGLHHHLIWWAKFHVQYREFDGLKALVKSGPSESSGQGTRKEAARASSGPKSLAPISTTNFLFCILCDPIKNGFSPR